MVELPQGSVRLATNGHTEIQAYINTQQNLFGTQFHPEFDQDSGNAIFLRDRALLEAHQHDVDMILSSGPSLDTGPVFFNFFLSL